VGDLTWAKGAYESVRGLIHSEWRKDDSGLSLQVIVPVGVTATVHIPRTGTQKITEDGRPLDEAKGIRILRRDPAATICEVGGGRYAFRVRN
jgi:alpha-L-rhamnosidase